MRASLDGAVFSLGGRDWIIHEDVDDEGRRGFWSECDGCGWTTSGGDDARSDHVCWFDDRGRMATVAGWMSAEGYDTDEIVRMIEKPRSYNDEADQAGVR